MSVQVKSIFRPIKLKLCSGDSPEAVCYRVYEELTKRWFYDELKIVGIQYRVPNDSADEFEWVYLFDKSHHAFDFFIKYLQKNQPEWMRKYTVITEDKPIDVDKFMEITKNDCEYFKSVKIKVYAYDPMFDGRLMQIRITNAYLSTEFFNSESEEFCLVVDVEQETVCEAKPDARSVGCFPYVDEKELTDRLWKEIHRQTTLFGKQTKSKICAYGGTILNQNYDNIAVFIDPEYTEWDFSLRNSNNFWYYELSKAEPTEVGKITKAQIRKWIKHFATLNSVSFHTDIFSYNEEDCCLRTTTVKLYKEADGTGKYVFYIHDFSPEIGY